MVAVSFQSPYYEVYWSVSKHYHDNGIKYTSIAKNIDCTWQTLKKASKAPSKTATVKESSLRLTESLSTYLDLFIRSHFASCQSLEL